MPLKSYRLKGTLKKKKRKKKGQTKDLLSGGITALAGIALFSEAASAIRRI